MRPIPKVLLSCLLCLLLGWSGAAAAFPDVEAGSWYRDAVEEMTASGLLSGYPDGSFRPGQTISAAEFVTITARTAGAAPSQGQTAHWAAGYLQAALEKGWYDWDELPPTGEKFDQPIPRQLAVKVLMRALLPERRGDYNTERAKISDFSQLDGRYYEAVLAAYAAGVVKGDSSSTFRPHSGLSRAEACILIQRAKQAAGGSTAPAPDPGTTPETPPSPVVTVQGGVTENGALQVKGTQLCNQAGEPVVLRGMSTHGLQWYGSFANAQSIRNTAQHGANVFRLAMYTGEGGYLSQPEAMKQTLIAAADAAIAQDLYVILDWHILSDGDPSAHTEEAVAFFTEMAKRYKDSPAVLYEICNEPNGNISWSGNVKPYAEKVVQAIRAQAPKAVILIGSPTWSQDIHQAAADPVAGENLMYTLHFYAGTHGQELRDRIDAVRAKGLPVFVSEWGTSRADGSGGVFLAESAQWLDFLAQRGISWCNWSLCDKGETSAALKPGTSPNGVWSQESLTQSGQFVFSRFGQ